MTKKVKLLHCDAVGADPEVFIRDLESNIFVPSTDLIGGNKHFPLKTSVAGFTIQEDNVLGEYNIPPSRTKEDFRKNILLGLKLFEEKLPPTKYRVEIATSHKFRMDQLTDPRAEEFGCEPDRNAWLKGAFNKKPDIPLDGLRSAGGHVHVGYKFNDDLYQGDGPTSEEIEHVNINIIRWLDLLLGVPSMKLDKDTERRKLYGKAGAYRDKPYGVEYRTLSSFWLKEAGLIDWVYDKTHEAVNHVADLELLNDNISEKVMAAINLNDEAAIDSLVDEYSLQVGDCPF